jgi:hypothetical protein
VKKIDTLDGRSEFYPRIFAVENQRLQHTNRIRDRVEIRQRKSLLPAKNAPPLRWQGRRLISTLEVGIAFD